MNFNDFVGKVQNLTALGTEGDTISAIRATLTTLGERLHGKETEHLASQLPREIGHYLHDAKNTDEAFDVDEFFSRVASREGEGVGRPQAMHHARCVMSVVEEAVTPGQMGDVRSQLPEDYSSLFDMGKSGAD